MLIRNTNDSIENQIARVAEGFGKGVTNYQAGQDKQRNQGLQDEALKRQRAIQSFEVENKLAEQSGRVVAGSGLGERILKGDFPAAGELEALPFSKKYEREQRKIDQENTKYKADVADSEYKATQRSLPLEEQDTYKRQAKIAEIAATGKAAGRDYSAVDGMRKELSTLPINKEMIQIDNALTKISTAPKSAAGDMSRVFGYMKIQDPNSTVREGEYASAKNAGGADDKLISAYNNALNGQLLSEQQRGDFTNSAAKLARSQHKTFMAATAPHRKRVGDLKLDGSQIFPTFGNQSVYDAPDEVAPSAAAPTKGSPWEKYK